MLPQFVPLESTAADKLGIGKKRAVDGEKSPPALQHCRGEPGLRSRVELPVGAPLFGRVLSGATRSDTPQVARSPAEGRGERKLSPRTLKNTGVERMSAREAGCALTPTISPGVRRAERSARGQTTAARIVQSPSERGCHRTPPQCHRAGNMPRARTPFRENSEESPATIRNAAWSETRSPARRRRASIGACQGAMGSRHDKILMEQHHRAFYQWHHKFWAEAEHSCLTVISGSDRSTC
jgi:hypothetical protein